MDQLENSQNSSRIIEKHVRLTYGKSKLWEMFSHGSDSNFIGGSGENIRSSFEKRSARVTEVDVSLQDFKKTTFKSTFLAEKSVT